MIQKFVHFFYKINLWFEKIQGTEEELAKRGLRLGGAVRSKFGIGMRIEK